MGKTKADPGAQRSAAKAKRLRYAQGLWQAMSQREAARQAGYGGSERNLDVQASKLATHPEVLAELERLRAAGREEVVKVAEKARVLEILTDQAFGGGGRYLRFDAAGNFTGVDLKRMQEDGAVHLLQGFEVTKDGMRYKFAPSQGAVDRLTRLLGWAEAERVRLTLEGADLRKLSDAELIAKCKELGIEPDG